MRAISESSEEAGITPEDVAERKLSGISGQIRDYKKTAEELGVGENHSPGYC